MRLCVLLLALAVLAPAPVLAAKPGAAGAPKPAYEEAYQKARNAYYRFDADRKKQKLRENWKRLAEQFQTIADKFPDSPRAADALFTAGKLLRELYARSRAKADLEQSVALFRRLVERYPQSALADDGQLYIALSWIEYRKDPEVARKELVYLVQHFPEGDVTPKASRMLEDLGGPKAPEPVPETAPASSPPRPTTEPATEVARKPVAEETRPVLENIKYWSNPGYTRIALYTRTKATYRVGKLPEDKKANLPPRLYLDLKETALADDMSGPIVVREKGLVRQIRFAPRDEGFIRVVVDLEADCTPRVFPMSNPERVVLDVASSEDELATLIEEKTDVPEPAEPVAEPAPEVKVGPKPTPEPAAKPEVKPAPEPKPEVPQKVVVLEPLPKPDDLRKLKKKSKPGSSLSMLAGLKVKRVVIDPGHGGRDPGAIGKTGTLEKDLALDLAKRVGELLQQELALEVLYTREDDRFVELEERTGYANEHSADLFISIHLNAHTDRDLSGVETFYLDLTNDKYSIKLAARENATSEKSISDLQFILADLALKSHVDDSISLSRFVQKALVGTIRRGFDKIKDLGVKAALFYVLIGARMPSILIEASFITNTAEEKRLKSKKYRKGLAEGIFTGIKNFIEERNRLMGSEL